MAGIPGLDVSWMAYSRPDMRTSSSTSSFTHHHDSHSPRASSPPAHHSTQTSTRRTSFSTSSSSKDSNHSPPSPGRRASLTQFFPPMSHGSKTDSPSSGGAGGQHHQPHPGPSPTSPSTPAVTPTNAKPTPPSQPPHPPKRSTSWLSNISSKFSAAAHFAPHDGLDLTNKKSPGSPSGEHPPSSPGFFISTLRRLSTPMPSRNVREYPATCPCPRMVLNKNTTRERCGIEGLDGAKLRKVAFSLDVQIAPGDLEGEKAARKREEEKAARREKRKAEKEAKKAKEKKEKEKDGKEKQGEKKEEGEGEKQKVEGEEKKEEVPVETFRNRPIHRKRTKNPSLIYTRCCELRESHPMAALLTQLSHYGPEGSSICTIDLSGENLTLTDALAFSDFLTLVPVGKVILDGCGLIDESVRVVLAGLLAVRCPRRVSRISVEGQSAQESTATNGQTTPQPRPSLAGTDGRASTETADSATNTATTVNTTDTPNTSTTSAAIVEPLKPPPQPAAKTIPPLHGGFVTHLSLRNNPKLTRSGWSYISLFVHMCHSLKSLDLSYIPLPKPLVPRTSPNGNQAQAQAQAQPVRDVASVFALALRERLGGASLEVLEMNFCSLTVPQLSTILSGLENTSLKKLGLAGNALTTDSFERVGIFLKNSTLEALDLSHNPSLDGAMDVLAAAMNASSTLLALAMQACSLTPSSLQILLPALATMPNFRLLNLNANPALFSTQPDAVQSLRRWLPACPELRKLQLEGTGMGPDSAIALFEVVPECPKVAHLNFAGNPIFGTVGPAKTTLVKGAVEAAPVAEAKVEESTEEGEVRSAEDTAFFTALLAAAKCSQTLVRVDLSPLPEGSATPTLRALQKQVLAYCLGNMGRNALSNEGAAPEDVDKKDDVDEKKDTEDDVFKQQEAYLSNAGTGVVKALGVCLGNTPATTPLSPLTPHTPLEVQGHKAHQMSVALLLHAREIRNAVEGKLTKLRAEGTHVPLLPTASLSPSATESARREGQSLQARERDYEFRRLQFLHETLTNVIRKFEAEYPEHALPASRPSSPAPAPNSVERKASLRSMNSSENAEAEVADTTAHELGSEDEETLIRPISRRGSDLSMRSKMLNFEEGRTLRRSWEGGGIVLNLELGGEGVVVDDAIGSGEEGEVTEGEEVNREARKVVEGAVEVGREVEKEVEREAIEREVQGRRF